MLANRKGKIIIYECGQHFGRQLIKTNITKIKSAWALPALCVVRKVGPQRPWPQPSVPAPQHRHAKEGKEFQWLHKKTSQRNPACGCHRGVAWCLPKSASGLKGVWREREERRGEDPSRQGCSSPQIPGHRASSTVGWGWSSGGCQRTAGSYCPRLRCAMAVTVLWAQRACLAVGARGDIGWNVVTLATFRASARNQGL